MVIEKIKQLLGPKRIEALKDLKVVLLALISGEYKSPKTQIKALERKLMVRGKDYNRLIAKIKQNNAEMALLDKKLSAMEAQLIDNIFEHAQSITPETPEEVEQEEKFPERKIFDISKYLKK
jgi:hypothetical protein